MYVAAGMLVEPIQTLMYSAANLQVPCEPPVKIIEEEPMISKRQRINLFA